MATRTGSKTRWPLGDDLSEGVLPVEGDGKLAVSVTSAACCQAKNSVMTRKGLSAEQAVFGRSLRFTEHWTVDHDDDVLVSVLGAHGPAWRATQIRSAVKLQLLRAVRAKRCVEQCFARHFWYKANSVLVAASYFWIPAVGRGRRREDAERWRGPATVVAKEGVCRCHVAYHARILLVGREQMRHATCLETPAAEDIANDMNFVGQTEDRSYHDVADENVESRGEPRKRRSDLAIQDGMAVHPLDPLLSVPSLVTLIGRTLRMVKWDRQPCNRTDFDFTSALPALRSHPKTESCHASRRACRR